LIQLADIEAAAKRLAGWAVRTPLVEGQLLNRDLGFRLLLKAECLQRTGSFKFRGAYNRISQFTAAERKRGIVAYSSGNHAQGVAHAAALLGIPAVIIMPRDAPQLKIENTKAYGAEVVLYDRFGESREAIGAKLSAERGLILVPPFDDPNIMAGQGTVGLEIAAWCKEAGVTPDAVLVNCGGGGLSAGTFTAIHAMFPKAELYTVEPADFDDTRRSLAAGVRMGAPNTKISFCDALLTPKPGELTFPVIHGLGARGLGVSDDEVKVAIRAAALHLKVVLEPGGAAALAAALHGPWQGSGKTVIAVGSGGNIDPALYIDILSGR
jgi:threonine dehydratase